MAWPVPQDLLLSAPNLTWDWDAEGAAEAQVKKYLDSFRITEGRVVLMATAAEHAKLSPQATWEKEPWYGTEYNVQRFDEDFIGQVTISFIAYLHRRTADVSLSSCRLRPRTRFLNCSCLDQTSLFQQI